MDRTNIAMARSDEAKVFNDFLSRHEFSDERKTEISIKTDPTTLRRKKFIKGIEEMIVYVEAEINGFKHILPKKVKVEDQNGERGTNTKSKRRLVWYFYSNRDKTWKTELRYGSAPVQFRPDVISIDCHNLRGIAAIYKEVIEVTKLGGFDDKLSELAARKARKATRVKGSRN